MRNIAANKIIRGEKITIHSERLLKENEYLHIFHLSKYSMEINLMVFTFRICFYLWESLIKDE